MSLEIGTVAENAAAAAGAGIAAAGTAGEREMGSLAQRALFAEALLNAVKAHVNELKTVAK